MSPDKLPGQPFDAGSHKQPPIEDFYREVGLTPPAERHEPASSGRTRDTVAAVVAVGAIVGGVVAIANTGGEAPVLPQEDRVSRSVDAATFDYDLRHPTLKALDDAKGRLPHITNGNGKTAALFQKALDLATAQLVVGGYYEKDGLSGASITDIPLKQKVNSITYTLSVDKLKPDLLDDDPDALKNARDTITHTAPTPQIAAGATEYIEGTFANHKLGYVTDETDITEATTAVNDPVKGVTSPVVKTGVAKVVDESWAIEALDHAITYEPAPDQAHAAAAHIADPDFKRTVDRAIDAPTRYGYNEAAGDLRSDLNTARFKDLSALENPASFSNNLKEAHDACQTFETDTLAALKAANAGFGKLLASETSVKILPSLDTLPALKNGKEVIDLGDVDTTEVADNSFSTAYQRAEKQTKTTDQFGSIYINKDGVMTTDFENGINDSARQQLADIIAHNQPLLQEALASGALNIVRFNLSTLAHPAYSDVSREVYINFDKNSKSTVDQINTALTNEMSRAVYRNYFDGVEVTPEEHKQIADACFSLKKLAYEGIQSSLDYSGVLDDLLNKAYANHKEIVKTLKTAVEEKNLAGKMVRDTTGYDTTTYNQCDYVGDAYGLLQSAISATPGAEKIDYKELAYLYSSDSFKKFYEQVDTAIRYNSVYGEVIDQANYTDLSNDDLHGVINLPSDNPSELFATLLSDMANSEEAFKEKLDKLEPAQRAVVTRAIRVMCTAGATHAPSLAGLFNHFDKKFGN